MVEMVEDVADRKTPTKIWINEVRPKGISIYGEKQWMDWELFIDTLVDGTSGYGWTHPSRLEDYRWDLGWFESGRRAVFYMNEVNWGALEASDCKSNSVDFPPEIHIYKLLMV